MSTPYHHCACPSSAFRLSCYFGVVGSSLGFFWTVFALLKLLLRSQKVFLSGHQPRLVHRTQASAILRLSMHQQAKMSRIGTRLTLHHSSSFTSVSGYGSYLLWISSSTPPMTQGPRRLFASHTVGAHLTSRCVHGSCLWIHYTRVVLHVIMQRFEYKFTIDTIFINDWIIPSTRTQSWFCSSSDVAEVTHACSRLDSNLHVLRGSLTSFGSWSNQQAPKAHSKMLIPWSNL